MTAAEAARLDQTATDVAAPASDGPAIGRGDIELAALLIAMLAVILVLVLVMGVTPPGLS